MKKIDQLLSGEIQHSLYPFFWQKGQGPEIIQEYIEKMYQQGIYNFCVESRPHPDFLEQGWWDTMDVILKSAKDKGMKIWILDDARFPTGYANGKVPPHLQKRYLACHRYDLCGGAGELELNVSLPCGFRGMMDKSHGEDKNLFVILCRNDISSDKGIVEGSQQDVTDQVHDGMLLLDLPEGDYSVFVLYQTRAGKEKGTNEYLDPMSAQATKVLLEEVYQKHYDHYAREFGKTIQGFFSDEPRFGSSPSRTDRLGRLDLTLPWNDRVLEELKSRGFGPADLIWLFDGENTAFAGGVRYAYMDTITQLYRDNFSREIGKWCQDHGVLYLGHVIEDDNAHARVGQGAGHYFRAMAGEDVAGIDVIGGQIVPGMAYHHDSFMSNGSDGEFYHYALERMACSCAKLEPRKQGRVMCEAYGAYGWGEGLKMMKWITDHMVSHGVNLIVPHAFDPAPFPDWDCPPHFYAHGMNPQYPYFGVFTAYADRLCHLFKGGAQQAQVGVLYHAAGEWSGETVLIQTLCKVLEQHQADCNILSEDYLAQCKTEQGGFSVNGFDYRILLVPGCTHLPQAIADRLERIAAACPVYFVGEIPAECPWGNLVELSELPELVKDFRTVKTDREMPFLHVYRYSQEDGDGLMFMNTHASRTVSGNVTIPGRGSWCIYDALENKLYTLEGEETEKGFAFHLELQAYESLILVEGTCSTPRPRQGRLLSQKEDGLSIALKEYNAPDYTPIQRHTVGNLAGEYPRFSGSVQYTFTTRLDSPQVIADFTGSEVMALEVNGHPCGVRIAPPYQFDISPFACKGENTFTLTVVNNLARALRDPFSMHNPVEGVGLTGPIRFFEKI